MDAIKTKQHEKSFSEHEIVLQMLHDLNQLERNILGLYFYEKLTVDSISALIDIPVKSVKSHLTSVIKTISGEIKGEEPVYVQETQKNEKKSRGKGKEQFFNFPVHDR